jgi:methionyl-tRNA synthetase
LQETTYFFKLSAYQDRLLNFYKEHPDFVTPKERLHEVISFVESGLKDLSISRMTVSWGVPFPRDEKHTIYVWVEALTNYITGLGYGNPQKREIFDMWWPAHLQILGKDIIKFHAVFWPALLMAAQLPLPKKLLVHGWIQVDKQKMSKSIGNVIDPVPLGNEYGAEPVRYFLARYLPINQDGDFTLIHLEQAIESDLANDLGNLLNRLVTLATRYDSVNLPTILTWSQISLDLRDEMYTMIDEVIKHFSDYTFHLGLARLWKYIGLVNRYFHEQEPWKLVMSDKQQFQECLSATAHGLYAISVMLWPIMPQKMELICDSLGVPFTCTGAVIDTLKLNTWNLQFRLTNNGPLFVKPSLYKKDTMEKKEINSQETSEQVITESDITFDDFAKVELFVGRIEQCAIVEKSDKLFSLQVDFGVHGKKHIFSGIRNWFVPSDLLGKKAVFVYNLKPRKMLNIFSEGMLLCTEDGQGRPLPVFISDAISQGTRLK